LDSVHDVNFPTAQLAEFFYQQLAGRDGFSDDPFLTDFALLQHAKKPMK